MDRLITNNNNYKLNELISANFPFYVYKAINQAGHQVIVKKTGGAEDTWHALTEAYRMIGGDDEYYSRTSFWYGHKKAKIHQVNDKELLIKQFAYLIRCSSNYNINACTLEIDINGNPILIYDYIKGVNFKNARVSSKIDLFISMIPALMKAVSNCPHGDLSFENLLVHDDHKKFSILDPAVLIDQLFFTNTEYYPLVPPLFYQPKTGYTNYPDQLAIGLMLYKLLTGINPLKEMSDFPFWAKEDGFSCHCIDKDIYSVTSILPENWFVSFDIDQYIYAIRSQLKYPFDSQNLENPNRFRVEDYQIGFPSEFFDIKKPKLVNCNISDELSDFCMSLIFSYEPVHWYVNKIQRLIAHNRH